MTKDGKIISSMQQKHRQINRFLEIIDESLSSLPKNKVLSIIDFGSGKAYLTFIMYYYLTYIKKIQVDITGVELKKDLVEKCTSSAKNHGYNSLHFVQGDISTFEPSKQIDMILSLHACDTATDQVIFFGIHHDIKAILAAPCCHKETNSQIKTNTLPILTRYGLIKERFSSLATDAIRANLLAFSGYKTQILEFIDLKATPKNILIRAISSSLPQLTKDKALKEAEDLIFALSLSPTLFNLLKQNGKIS